jgi:hypothetical protein
MSVEEAFIKHTCPEKEKSYMAWNNGKNVVQTFASSDSQNAWVNLGGIGWRRIQTGAVDGVTNLFLMFNAAKANGRMVNVFLTDDSNQFITIAYLN